MQGSVSEFRIYNGVLSPIQVAATQALGTNQLLSSASPKLSASISEGNLTLSWPLTSAGFSLYSSSTLGGNAGWKLASGTQAVVGSNVQVTIPATGTASFFQLRQ
jgi:hypothetical protein